MKLLTIRKNLEYSIGVATEFGVLDLGAAADHFRLPVPKTVDDLIQAGTNGSKKVEELLFKAKVENDRSLYISESKINYGPCVTSPEKIVCVGLNYRKHAEESGMNIPTSPVLFGKFKNALAAHHDFIAVPKTTKKMDYEVELVIVIGKTAQNVSESEALSYVFGYTIGNDLSARDLQMRSGQWLLGKSIDGFAPIGPYLVTADEIIDPNSLTLDCRVNGVLRQKSSTSDMIFNCAYLVHYISQHMTLKPGDLIFTGTPEGVILGYPEEKQKWLRSGDEICASITGLGELCVSLK